MLLWFYFYFILPFFYSAMSFVYRKLLNYFFFGNKILVIVSARYPAIPAQLFQGSPSCHYRHSMPFPKFTCHARLVLTWHSCCSRKVVQKAGHKSKHICNFWCWCNFTAEKAQLFSFPIHQTFPPPPPFFGWHGRHCIWWLRGLIWLGSWFASFASELAWQLHSDIFLLFVEGKQKLGCFSC